MDLDWIDRDTAPLIMSASSGLIATLALLFAVGSFWWLHARHGRLKSYAPEAFAGYMKPEEVTIRLPLAIANTGAAPTVVTDLRLHLVTSGNDELALAWHTFRNSLRPGPEDSPDFKYPFAIAGRAVSEQHIEFRSKKLTLLSFLSGEPVTAIVQAKDGRTNRWRRILKFTLHIEVMADPDRYITYGNHPESWPDDQLERARAAFAELRDKINERQGRRHVTAVTEHVATRPE